MSYVDAYTKLTDSALSSLETIDKSEDVHPFVVQTAAQLHQISTDIPEFYIGEFFNIFKDAVVERLRAESADCQKALNDANAEAAAASTELQARLAAAHAGGDREAEHAVWREREIRQAECQAKVDAASNRGNVLSLRLGAFQELALAMGIDLS
jgi:hypothetical protein